MAEPQIHQEWLLTDGIGGYASSTALGPATRRYHGLWVAATQPPLGRMVILSQLEAHIIAPPADFRLPVVQYAEKDIPTNCLHPKIFQAFPFPLWRYEADGLEFSVEAFLRRGGAGAIVSYDLKTEVRDWLIEIHPLLALRSFHHLRQSDRDFHVEQVTKSGLHIVSGPTWQAAEAPGVYLWSDKGEARPAPAWRHGILYQKERERGFDYTESLFVPGVFKVTGSGPAKFHIFCSLSAPTKVDVEAEKQAETERRKKIISSANIKYDEKSDARISALLASADAFIVDREVVGRLSSSVIAGYHWFGDWGRDAMISLPGLTLTTGGLEHAREIFHTFASAIDGGLLPNCFSEETDQPQYNSVDASLWFIQAAWAYLEATGDMEFVRDRIWPACVEIVESYSRGTRFGIRADADGLIAAGDENTQLTWMDAKVGGVPVTPRHGKAVEVNALWLSALRIVQEVAKKLNHTPPAFCGKADAVRAAFEKAFWNQKKNCLYDCIGPDGKADAAVRPNQIFAVSLPFAPLAGERAERVVKVVREKLYTPFGLRTLAPDEPGYCAKYEGGPDQRDAAYHQGTVWPWLLGPFIEAYLKVNGFSDEAKTEARNMINRAMESMDALGLGFVGEIFDAEPPHTPRGCIAQAWSVAELLRAWQLVEAGTR